MSKKKVLIVTQEMNPYTELTEISAIARKLSQQIQDEGMEIRVLMPRYGTINERRHRLHEVVRLSGMNIIVDDDDFPLIIKVASLPGARMQIYFLDNDDFFKRRQMFEDDQGKPFDDNADRMIFFCKGVLETVKKFGWAPDIIHCHGWITSLLPLYVKTAYHHDPLFQDAKVVYSLYSQTVESSFPEEFSEKASINNLEAKDLKAYQNGDVINLHAGAIEFSDAVIIGDEHTSEQYQEIAQTAGKAVMPLQEAEHSFGEYINFYHTLLEEKVAS